MAVNSFMQNAKCPIVLISTGESGELLCVVWSSVNELTLSWFQYSITVVFSSADFCHSLDSGLCSSREESRGRVQVRFTDSGCKSSIGFQLSVKSNQAITLVFVLLWFKIGQVV